MLKNSPVPYSPKKEKTRDLFRKIGGYSFLIHSIMIRLMPNYWIEPGSSVRAHHKGSEVVCLLMKQLKKFSQERQIKVIVLIQYDILTISAYLKKAERLVHGLEQDAIDVLDLKPAFQEIMNQTPERYASFFNKQGGHMSFEGNTFIAEQLELFMRQRSVL